MYAVKNTDSAQHANDGSTWTGTIALNNPDLGLRMDAASGNITNASVTDSVFWDNKNGGISMCCSNSVSATFNRVTIGHSAVTMSGDFMGGIGNFSSGGAKTASNLIIRNVNGGDVTGLTATFCDSFSNGATSCSATERQTYDPLANGLLYLPRIEAGSALKTAGSEGKQIGAQIVNRLGVTGSLYGETNWNTDTAVTLWPWPNEARLKKNMCTDVGITRGFCGSTSLTTYIMEYLGNRNPYAGSGDVTPPSAPTNLQVL